MNIIKIIVAAIVLAMALAAGQALAQSAHLRNQSGGEIVLTSRPCPVNGGQYDRLREAYTVGGDNRIISGCWAHIDNMIHVAWFKPDGSTDLRVYLVSDFEFRGFDKQQHRY